MVRAFFTLACSALESRSQRAAWRLSCLDVNCKKVSCGQIGTRSVIVRMVVGWQLREMGSVQRTYVAGLYRCSVGGNSVLTLRLNRAFSRPDIMAVELSFLGW